MATFCCAAGPSSLSLALVQVAVTLWLIPSSPVIDCLLLNMSPSFSTCVSVRVCVFLYVCLYVFMCVCMCVKESEGCRRGQHFPHLSLGESQLHTPRVLSPHLLLKTHWMRKPEVPPL